MGDVAVPNDWQLGDLVVTHINKHIGIIVALQGSDEDTVMVYWPTGVDSCARNALFPACFQF